MIGVMIGGPKDGLVVVLRCPSREYHFPRYAPLPPYWWASAPEETILVTRYVYRCAFRAPGGWYYVYEGLRP